MKTVRQESSWLKGALTSTLHGAWPCQKLPQGYTTIRCTKERNNPSLLKSQLTMLTASKTIWNCLCPCGSAPNARATSPLCFCLGVHRGVTAKKEKNKKRARSARKGNSAPIQISTALPCVAIMLRVLEAWMSCFWRRAQHLQCVGTNTECHNHAQVVSNIFKYSQKNSSKKYQNDVTHLLLKKRHKTSVSHESNRMKPALEL